MFRFDTPARPAAASAAAATAAAAAPPAALRHRAERVHEPEVDVVELTGGGRHGVEVLRAAGLIRQRDQLEQLLRRRIEPAGRNLIRSGTAVRSPDRSRVRRAPTGRRARSASVGTVEYASYGLREWLPV